MVFISIGFAVLNYFIIYKIVEGAVAEGIQMSKTQLSAEIARHVAAALQEQQQQAAAPPAWPPQTPAGPQYGASWAPSSPEPAASRAPSYSGAGIAAHLIPSESPGMGLCSNCGKRQSTERLTCWNCDARFTLSP